MFLRILQHLLSTGKALRTVIDKQLRQFFDGLMEGLGPDAKEYFDNIFLDIFPQTTRTLIEWERSFGILGNITDLTEQERRDRLEGTWKETGGQSPKYIQDTLRSRGFDVYVHEWWVGNVFPFSAVYCGQVDAECGEAVAVCTRVIPEAKVPLDYLAPDNQTAVPGKGYPLVNKVSTTSPIFINLCGEAIAECGEGTAECGEISGITSSIVVYETTTDPLTFPYYIYIGDATFPDIAQVPIERKDEFEQLCLKLRPLQNWLGILVEYI